MGSQRVRHDVTEQQQDLFIYFWLHWVFVAACRLSPAAASGGSSLAAVRGLLMLVACVAEHRL